MKNVTIAAFAALLAVALVDVAAAQQQDKGQQKCIANTMKRAGKLSSTVVQDADGCVNRTAKGKLPTGVSGQDCLTADLKGKVGKATSKLGDEFTKSCGTPPDFALTDAPTLSDAHIDENISVIGDTFGFDLDAALAASAGVDPKAGCSRAILKGLRKVEDTIHKELARCAKLGLKDGSIQDDAAFQACLDTVKSDPRNKLTKATAKLQLVLDAKCPAGDLVSVFPDISPICTTYGFGTTSAGLASCVGARLQCRVCRIWNDGYAYDRDCDEFDNGTVDGSCPECPNGVVDAGEECDDGNLVDGDGCTSECIDEFCGDGVINDSGAEECDDGVANSDSTPDACRLDCTEPVCGDGVTDPSNGEECDDGNTNQDDGCTNQCTSCGNGIAGGLEQCDDGNNDDGDCCAADCTFEALDDPCVDAPTTECTAPGCNGAGECVERPANESASCDDGDPCSISSECQSGVCATTGTVVTGQACQWAVVGWPDPLVQAETGNGTQIIGDFCGSHIFIGESSIMTGDMVASDVDDGGVSAEFSTSVNADAGDILTNNGSVQGVAAVLLPGIGSSSIAAGQVVAKTPPPTFYDTTGSDPRVGLCSDAQSDLATNTEALLDALSTTTDFGSTYAGLPAGTAAPTINAVNVGGINVFDFDNFNGNNDVTINLNGGGSTDTVFVMRIANQFDSGIRWQFNLLNGLTPNHLIWYGKGATGTKCDIGESNVGAGTIFCSATRIRVRVNSVWEGAVFGGFPALLRIGDNVTLTHNAFDGL